MSTTYRVLSAGTEKPMRYGRETGEEFACLRLRVGKREKLEVLQLTDEEALRLAVELVNSVRRRIKEDQ